MRKYRGYDLERARVKRAERIALLQTCTCAWPVITLRNGSGHDPDCPAHAVWVKDWEKRR